MSNTLIITADNIELMRIIGLLFISSILSMPCWAYSMYQYSLGSAKYLEPNRSKDGLAISIAFLIYATVFGISGYIATSVTIAVFGMFMLITSSINLIKYCISKNSKLINVNI